MGWTRDREVQCGCGWEGECGETLWIAVPIQKFVGDTLVKLPHVTQYLCPQCRADLTGQTWAAAFKITIVDLPSGGFGKVFDRYSKASLREDYYRTTTIRTDKEILDAFAEASEEIRRNTVLEDGYTVKNHEARRRAAERRRKDRERGRWWGRPLRRGRIGPRDRH